MLGLKRKSSNAGSLTPNKEWDEVLCPICMDHPHNAILLKCSSYEKGCRSYICDTSYRHSNCLDRFKEWNADTKGNQSGNNPSNPSTSDDPMDAYLDLGLGTSLSVVNENHSVNGSSSDPVVGVPGGSIVHNLNLNENLALQGEDLLELNISNPSWDMNISGTNNLENLSETKLMSKCPLCRGAILGWEVADARTYLNQKQRSCSHESCSFLGNYRELRRHARNDHPGARPANVDPSRQRAWQRLEHQREHDDIVSAVRSAIPGSVVFGDYVIESGDRMAGERENGAGEGNGPWLSTFFLFQMISSMDTESRARSRAWTRHRRLGGESSGRRRFLWGENLLGVQDDEINEVDADLTILSDPDDDVISIPRRRRRLTRSTSVENQP